VQTLSFVFKNTHCRAGGSQWQ